MDGGTLEPMVKPWWLMPPVFLAAMILMGVLTVGVFALDWYFDELASRWLNLLF